ncbi:TlpA family protein disulfide reductase [Sphingobacterium faecium]|nr:TlpA disulfide reductase family protein [Sphingobacterium faecium]WGQ12805.1 TlpA disulfide reductase family protein [Sphingobacterium faecium]
MLFSVGVARPQSGELGTANNKNITALNIGDQIPDELWNTPLQVVNHPQGKKTITLGEYKDKLIILDFWATWCVPCIKAFPELSELSKDFSTQLQIILATSEEQKKITDFLIKRKSPLTSIVEDKTLKVVFPKNSVPHEIWIKDGKVFAITDTYYVNSKTIKQVLNGEITSLTEKKVNRSYNLNEPLLIDGNGGGKNDLLYHSVITGYLDGIGGSGVFADTLGRYKLRVLNGTAFDLYTYAAGRIDYSFYIKNRTLNTTSVKRKLQDLNTSDPSHRPDFFCYELIVPKSLEEKAPYMMVDDLNKFFGNLYGIRGDIKTTTTKCWVLRKTKNPFTGTTKGGKAQATKDNDMLQFINEPFSNYFFSLAEANQDQSFPFVDRTSISDNVDMKVLFNRTDIKETQELLESYGLSLTLENCEIQLLILTDIKKENQL